MNARALATTVFLAVTLLAAPAQAADPDPEAPVVVDDAVTVWPGGYAEIDVLANDSDPGADDLALCRVPPPFSSGSSPKSVTVLAASAYDGDASPGTVIVQAGARATGTHTIDYYVCNHTRLTPAHLTVTVRPVQPVDVVADRKPDRIVVTNHNDRTTIFMATDRTGCRVDVGPARIGAGETRAFRVHRHTLHWMAFVARGSGVFDYGVVRDVELTGPSAPPGPKHTICGYAFGRQLPGIGASGS